MRPAQSSGWGPAVDWPAYHHRASTIQGCPPSTARCNPNDMMCASLAVASTTRPHLDFIHLETGTAQPSDECRLRTGRPHRQYTAAPQCRVGGGQPRQAVKPIVALSDHRLRAIVNIKHDGVVVASGGLYQLGNVSTLGQLAVLPLAAAQAQLGWAGLRAWELARGIDREPLRPQAAPEQVTERLAFPFPLVGAQMLRPALEALIGRAWGRSIRRNRCAGCVQLEGSLTEGGVRRTRRQTEGPSVAPDAALGQRAGERTGRGGSGRRVPLPHRRAGRPDPDQPAGRCRHPVRVVARAPAGSGVGAPARRSRRRGPGGGAGTGVGAAGTPPGLRRLAATAESAAAGAGDDPGIRRAAKEEWGARPVKRVQDRWEVETEWWRPQPVHRRYCLLELEGGRMETVFEDRRGGGWYRQSG